MKIVCSIAFLLVMSVSSTAIASERCEMLVADSRPGDSSEAASAFFSNAEAAYRDCRSDSVAVDIRAKAAINYGFANAIRNNVQTAVKAYKEALTLLSTQAGKYPDLTLDVLDKAMIAEVGAGMRSDAFAHAQQALDLRRAIYGADSDEAVDAILQVAMIYSDFEEYTSAESLLNEALLTARATCKRTQCRKLANVYSGFATYYAAQGDDDNEKRFADLAFAAAPDPVRKRKE
ncbi:MAG TPA: tetratricopeptide repeat protein [Thermoanaerobaculia bacterium]|nr:tetratricopeptide repeat protein [Thermoanaerobaculia bacterium]